MALGPSITRNYLHSLTTLPLNIPRYGLAITRLKLDSCDYAPSHSVRDALKTTPREHPTLLSVYAIIFSDDVGLEPPYPRSCLCNLVALPLEI
jgi:hypothetical protein